MSVENVKSTPNEDPIFYFTRLINCFYKTSAVQNDLVSAVNHGRSIWRAVIKYGTDPYKNILSRKEELMNIIKSNGYKLKDIEIIAK